MTFMSTLTRFGAGGGGGAGTSVSCPSIDVAEGSWVDATLTNASPDPVGVSFGTGADFVVEPSGLTVPGSGTATIRVYRTGTSAASDTLTIYEGGEETQVSITSNALEWVETAIAGGAVHAYDFLVATPSTDKIGALNITNTAGTGTYGASVITGAGGSVAISGAGNAAPFIANATWNRTSARTVIYALTVSGTTDGRSMGLGPGTGSNAAASLHSLARVSGNFQHQSPNFQNPVTVMAAAATLCLVVIRRLGADADGTKVDCFISRSGVAQSRTIIASAGTNTTGGYYLGGDGVVYFSQAATWHFLHVYNRVLTLSEINLGYADLIGLPRYTL
jgi:hypothetical protein